MLGKDNYENIRFENNYPFNVTISNLPATFPSHWHNYIELVVVLQGTLSYSINSSTYKLCSKDILLIQPGELHALTSNQESNSSYIMMQFDASYLLSLPDFKKNQYWIQTFHYLPYQENPALSNQMIALAAEISHLYHSELPYIDAKICTKFFEIFTLIGVYVISDSYILGIRKYAQDLPGHLSKSTHQSELTQKMVDVCSYLSQNCTQDISLTSTADYAGFSKYHFSRLFSEFTGSSFVEFLVKERLKKAVDLLLNEKLSITDVALMSGFTSLSTFNRCFQRYKNDSPSQFRKKYSGMKSML